MAGLQAKYADSAGLGLNLPLLLYFASVMKPSRYERSSVEKLLRKKTKDLRITKWPGPIASWLIGKLGDKEFQAHWRGKDEKDTLDRQWDAEFYQGIFHYTQGKYPAFNATLQKLTDVSRAEWSDEDFFLTRMWGSEFFLARYELEAGGSRN